MENHRFVKPNVICEVANTHAGSADYINTLIKQIGALSYSNKYIKFQPFKYDLTALEDFSYFDVYKRLFIERDEWKKIINLAIKLFAGVWMDINDSYSISVLEDNFNHIFGIKLQASFLYNEELIQQFRRLPLNGKNLILNISGYEPDEIKKIINRFSNFGFKSIILQVGFQSYPTAVEDSALNKILKLKELFPEYSVCIADHMDAQDQFSTILPLLAHAMGCSYIEKHICINRSETEFDYFSALQPPELQILFNCLDKYNLALGEVFINDAEKKYLALTKQHPVLKHDLAKGQLVAQSDLLYRRTNQLGLTFDEIRELQEKGWVLSSPKVRSEVITINDYKKANIAAIVACRLKSSRLKRKAVLPLYGIPSIQRCLQSCLEFPYVNKVVLATSTTQEDAELSDYLIEGVEFYQGDPDDVIKRYLDICELHDIDIVYRITGDNPCPSSEIAKIMIDQHLQSGADYTYTEDITIGLTTEIYNRTTLEAIQRKIGSAQYSEYMNWYVLNNREHFKVHKVELPEEYVRKNYRLTLDYESDFQLFNRLFEALDQKNLAPKLMNIFDILDNNPEISNLNNNINQFYANNSDLIDILEKQTKFPVEA